MFEWVQNCDFFIVRCILYLNQQNECINPNTGYNAH